MNNNTVLLSGITGFLGSHLAERLSKQYKVIGLVRSNSDLWRYNEIKNGNIRLISLNDEKQLNELSSLSPEFFIHSAWNGVPASGRDDWSAQTENIIFTTSLVSLAKDVGVKHFISFGSQAEYGAFNGRVDENYHCKPMTAYGASKLATLNIVEAFCLQNNIHWNWFRLFSLYGTRENFSWLIPSVIRNALQNKEMELTPCEQRYDYLSVSDFGAAIQKVLENEPISGVYNLTSNISVPIRTIVEKIIAKTKTKGNFNFGALPYRPNQVMHTEGNSELFFNTFNFKPQSNFDADLEALIPYYQSKL